MTIEDFISRGRKAHGYKYDYSKVVYTNSRTKVSIICPEHGEFEQLPEDHYRGCGCKACANCKPLTTKEFIDKAVEIHSGYYSYEKTNYVNTCSKVSVTCPVHGDFSITPSAHIHTKQGCRACGYTRMAKGQTLTTSEFIERASVVHNGKYSYNDVRYSHNTAPVSIKCPTHGVFFQRPIYHLGGSGCPECGRISAKLQFNPSKETILYYVRFPDYNLYKIGITHRSIEKRFYGDSIAYEILSSKVYPSGYLAWKHEQAILQKYSKVAYDGPPILYAGNSELFTTNILPKGIE